ncbi:MAG: CBS domain-containing protein [Acidobacteriota bacterium]
MKCPACGFENLPGAEICEACGSDLTFVELEEPELLIQQTLAEDTIDHLFPYPAITVEVGTSIGATLRLMQERQFGCALIVRGSKLVGIVTERDMLYKVANRITNLDVVPVDTIMTPNPGVVRHGDTLAKTLHLMAMHKYRHVPIVDDEERPVGFLSSKGIFKYLCQHALPGT